MSTVRVFLCSTYADLVGERTAVLATLEALQLQHKSMEHFGARSQRPIEACLEEVARANIIVVVVGYKYGSLVPGRSMSFTEAEYREATRLRKQCLVYMRDESIPVLRKYVEQDPAKIALFDSFCELLQSSHTVDRYSSVEDLSERVKHDVAQLVQLVEQQAEKQSQAEDLLLSELRDIARAAISSGVGEAALLGAVRAAVEDLRRPPPARGTLLDVLRRSLEPFWKSTKRATPTPWVFFSYSHADAEIVRAVARSLERFEVRVWIDQQELRVGDQMFDEIRSGLNRADAFVFFASKNAARSSWAIHEVEYAASRRITESGAAPVIPVVLDDVQLPPYLRDVLYVDLRDGNVEMAAARIASAVHRVPLDEITTRRRRRGA